MPTTRIRLTAVAASLALSAAFTLTAPAVHAEESMTEFGKKVAFDRKKGNCLGCHAIAGGVSPGLIGPPLVAMQARFPDRARLRAQIWDATEANPNSMMPPFGLHGALSDKEIDAIVDFMYTL